MFKMQDNISTGILTWRRSQHCPVLRKIPSITALSFGKNLHQRKTEWRLEKLALVLECQLFASDELTSLLPEEFKQSRDSW
jgi:hypothetical protein